MPLDAAALADLNQRISVCPRCALARGRTQTVPGDGDPASDLLFIGEAPGFHEDRQGRPFVGPAGKLLDQLLADIGRSRADVFVTNVLKCRPPNNRDPLPEEIAACAPFLTEQITQIRPRMIITLGRFAMNYFLPGASITRSHGRAVQAGRHWIYPVYHPAAALRSGAMLQTLREDFRRIPALLAETARPADAPAVDPDAEAGDAEAMQLPLL